MMETERADEHAAQTGATDSEIGDVETAGETTAAATLGGDTSDQRPVGADTLVKVAGEPEAGGGD